MKGMRDEATFWILHDSWTRTDHWEEMAHTMAQTSLNISDDVYCRVNNMLWWCLCMFENDVSCLMYDVGCWCILYIHKHTFRMIMQDANGDGCGGCCNLNGGFEPQDWWRIPEKTERWYESVSWSQQTTAYTCVNWDLMNTCNVTSWWWWWH